MQANKAITRFYVCTATSLATGATIAALTAGQYAVVEPHTNTVIPATGAINTTTYPKVRIAFYESAKTGLRFTDIIETKNITVSNLSSGAFAKEKVEYLGYDGSSALGIESTTTIVAGTDYIVRFELKSELKATGDYPLWKTCAYRATTANKSDLAWGLFKNMVSTFAREKEFEEFIRFGVLSDEAGVALTTSGGATVPTVFTVTKGSKIITVNQVCGTGSGTLVVPGDYIRILGTATTNAVYKIAAIDSTSITLDVPYQGESVSVGAGVTVANIRVILAATVAPSEMGIRFQGVPRKYVVGQIRYQKADWNTTTDGFDSTSLTVGQSYTKGVGTYEEVAQMEYELQGNEGDGARVAIPPRTFKADVTTIGSASVQTSLFNSTSYVAGTGYAPSYDLLQINWFNEDKSSQIVNTAKSKKSIIVAFGKPTTSTTNADATNLNTMLAVTA